MERRAFVSLIWSFMVLGRFKQTIRQWFGRGQPTIAEGWDRYARRHERDGKLGDEWNEPAAIGIDVPADELVAYLDRTVFGPFFGTCEVLLEIGPGGGRFTTVLLPRCRKLLAADTSANMLSLLKSRFGGDARLTCLHLDGRGLRGIADASVDAAFAYGVFVHLQHWDIYHYLTELRRVLKPGGKALIQHANTFSELGWKRFQKDVPGSLNRHKLPGTFTLMTPEIMAEFVRRAGLALVGCRTDVVRRDAITLIQA